MLGSAAPRSEQKRLNDPELEAMLVNWQRWRIGDPERRDDRLIESALDPDRMDRAGTGMKRGYHETYVPVVVRDALAVEEAVGSIPKELARCITTAYVLMVGRSDEDVAGALGYSRSTYYRRADDAKVMIKSRIYALRRRAQRQREAAERALSTCHVDNVDRNQ